MKITPVNQISKFDTNTPVIVFLTDGGKISPQDAKILGKTTQKKIEEYLKIEKPVKDQAFFHRLFDENSKKIFLATPGKIEKTTWLSLGAKLGKNLEEDSQKNIQLLFPQKLSYSFSVQFTEGLISGGYQFKNYKTKKNTDVEKEIELKVFEAPNDFAEILKEAKIIAESLKLVRDCCNKPGNDFTPSHFKEEMEKIAEAAKLKLEVIDEKKAKKLGMGCFCSVAKGSEEPAYVLTLQYRSTKKSAGHLMFVGKGLTFDSGGISIKPAASMEDMKFDMCGGGAVLGAIKAITELKPDVDVTAIIAAGENLINGKASKPGDIYKSYEGLNVEVINTDAEGRLILADALSYGVQRYKPDAVIDLATLTGACMVALGTHFAGLFSNHENFAKRLEESAKRTGENIWRLPLDPRFTKQIESSYADIKNTGGRFGGAITAAEFLQKFIGKTPWVHLDIAGTAWNNKALDYYPSVGASGFGMRLLVDLAMNWKTKP